MNQDTFYFIEHYYPAREEWVETDRKDRSTDLAEVLPLFYSDRKKGKPVRVMRKTVITDVDFIMGANIQPV